MACKKKVESAFDWIRFPTDLPKGNLLLVKAKTTLTTVHPDDIEYPIRNFSTEQLQEAGRSLSHRPVGLNHIHDALDPSKGIIQDAFTVDSNYNPDTQAVEALIYLPDKWIQIVKDLLATGRRDLFSVEYTWRDEKRTEKGVEFLGLTFDRIDLLYGLSAGDKGVEVYLTESATSRRHLLEAEVSLVQPEKGVKDELIQDSIDTSPEEPFVKEACNEGMEISKRLGEPMHKDFSKIKSGMVKQYGKDKGEQVYYAWLNKHGYDDTKAFPSKECKYESLIIPLPEKCECAACLKLHSVNMAIHPEVYAQEKAKSKPSQIELFGPSGLPQTIQEPELTIQELQPENDECNECKESKSQIPEKPVSPFASDPTPMSALTQPQDNKQPTDAAGVSASGMINMTVPESKKEGKTLEQSIPLKSGDLTYTDVDRSKQRVESECMNFDKKLIDLENRMKVIEDMMKRCPK